jgi:hypothetical protein
LDEVGKGAVFETGTQVVIETPVVVLIEGTQMYSMLSALAGALCANK